jgi:beta-1,4-mannosyltransferase
MQMGRGRATPGKKRAQRRRAARERRRHVVDGTLWEPDRGQERTRLAGMQAGAALPMERVGAWWSGGPMQRAEPARRRRAVAPDQGLAGRGALAHSEADGQLGVVRSSPQWVAPLGGGLEAIRRAGRQGGEAARRAVGALVGTLAPGLRVWQYRLTLVALTALLLAGLLRVQEIVNRMAPTVPAAWQQQVRWVEVLWLAPLPLAMALWVGWFVFAEAARPDPQPIAAPQLMPLPEGCGASAGPVRLVFRFCSRGENAGVLGDSVAAAHRALAKYGAPAGPHAVEVVTDQAIDLGDAATVYVVPQAYETTCGSRYKARALTYLQQVTQPGAADWHVYLDEESVVDVTAVAGIYEFIRGAQERAARACSPTARLIGQGGLLYQGGAALFRGADALRTGDDLGRFRLQYALGVPMFGIHGSYLVVRGIEEAALSFDVGPSNSMTEDAAWALRVWAHGWRFGWVRGYVHEQPPQRALDFVRQRARWLAGIRSVMCDASVPLRFRAVLIGYMLLWQVSMLPLLIALVALVTHVQPFTWARLPADLAWVTFVLAYLQGLDVQAVHRHPTSEGRGEQTTGVRAWLRRQVDRALEWPLVLGLFWYSLLEVAGVLFSLRPRQGFYVIEKPRLAGADGTGIARRLVSGEVVT